MKPHTAPSPPPPSSPSSPSSSTLADAGRYEVVLPPAPILHPSPLTVPPPRRRLGRGVRGVDRAAWLGAARTPLTGPVRIVVAAAKGGVGKTTVSLALAEVLAGLRADRVAVLDGQPVGGTAGLRVDAVEGHGLAVLLDELEAVAADDSVTAWTQYATVEHRSRVTVYGRPPVAGAELGITVYERLARHLERHWPILIVDTGAPEGRSALQAAIMQTATVLVVVCGPGSGTAQATAAWLAHVPTPPAMRVGVLVARGRGGSREALELLWQTCSSVLTLPADRALDADAPVPMVPGVRPVTRDVLTAIAGVVMQRGADALRRELG